MIMARITASTKQLTKLAINAVASRTVSLIAGMRFTIDSAPPDFNSKQVIIADRKGTMMKQSVVVVDTAIEQFWD